MTLETELDRLEAEASDRWDERWTVRVDRYADGDYNAYAFRMRGLNDNGHLVQDRLYITDNDEILVARKTIVREEIDSELLDTPTPELSA